MKILLVLLVPILFGISDEDQPQQKTKKYDKISIRKKMKLAKKLEADGSYHNAVQYYEDVYEERSNNTRIIAKLAQLNYALRDYEQAEKWYAELNELGDKAFPDMRFYYGRMLKMNGKFSEAADQFNLFIKEYDEDDAKKMKSLAKAELTGAEMAQQLMDNPVEVKMEHLPEGVNHNLTDFSPKPIGDNKLMYASLVSDTAIFVNTMKKKDYYSKILTADFDGTNWDKSQIMSAPINSSNKHTGNAVLGNEGRVMYLTQCNDDNSLEMRCKIYKSVKRDGQWTEPQPIDAVNNPDGTSTQPALGKDPDGNEVLFFSSDRKGSKGGLDIWYSIINEFGKFERPKNLGKIINTAGDEITPFYDIVNQKLYFSSNGHPNIGGLDVMFSEGNIDEWGEVQNAGFPINSIADDQYFALNDKSDLGYMVSNRKGVISPRGTTCCDDIFSIDLRREVNLYMKGYFTSKKDPKRKPIPGVEASLYQIDGSNFTYIDDVITSDKDMFYFKLDQGTKYKMNGAKEGYWPSIENVEAPVVEASDTIFKVFYIEEIIRKKIKVQRVYFAFDRSDVRADYVQRLDSLYDIMESNIAYLLEIAGHTDSKGPESYNIILSKKRARAAADYIISIGMQEDRLVVKGFGETMPIAPNELPDGRDNPIGRAKNRRVDFKLLTGDDEIEIDYDETGPNTTD